MAERVLLDPTELTTRGELDITPWIDADGPDWGDAAVVAQMSEQGRIGAVPVDISVPTRQIQIPLTLRTLGGTSFATVRSAIQAKMGLWQAQGGYIKRVTSSGGTVYCDITNATLSLGGSWTQAHKDYDLDALLTLEAIPDFYGNEEDLGDNTETTLPDITFTETTTNGGDFPLGDRVRVVVDDDSANNQRGLIWAFRGRHYNGGGLTALTAYEAESLVPLDTATKVAKVGASGGTVVTHGTLSTNWTPVLSTDVVFGGTFSLTHTGTNRIYARVFSTAGTTVQARFVYDVGDLVYPVENDAKRLYDGGTFHILDLGEARLDPTTGTHRWQGQVQAKGDAGAESFSVDRLYVVNQDESAGVLRAPINPGEGLVTYSARDEYNQSSGAATGKTAPVGGTYAAMTNSDTTDFDINATDHVLQRTAVSDTGTIDAVLAGRAIGLDLNFGTTAAQVNFSSSGLISSQGLMVRVVNNSNFFIVYTIGSGTTWRIAKRISGSLTIIWNAPVRFPVAASTWNKLRVVIEGSQWTVFDGTASGAWNHIASGIDADLAGTLATGDVYVYDSNTTSTADTRQYDNLGVWVPALDAVTYASQSTELATTGIRREDSTGTAYGPASNATGDLPRLPNRSSAGTVEVFAKPSRGDLQTLPDPGIDDISARVYRRPSYLTVS